MLELCVCSKAGCRLCLCGWWSWCPSRAARGWEYVFINSARSPRYPSCPSSLLPSRWRAAVAGGHDTTHLALFWKTAHFLAPAPASPIPSLRPQRTRQMYNQWFSVQQSINHEANAHWTDISWYKYIDICRRLLCYWHNLCIQSKNINLNFNLYLLN